MVDPRIVKLAEILTNYSIVIKKGSLIEVNAAVNAAPLALEVMKNILKKGAYPKMNVGLPGQHYTYFKYASDEQLKHFPELALYEAKKVDGSIGIGAPVNTRELTSIDPAKLSLRRKVTRPITDAFLKKNNWVIFQFPTNAMAQDADMSLEEFEDFVYGCCNVDWKAMEEKQTKLKKLMDDAETVQILAKDTDLKFSIKGRTSIKCCGTRNMPDGEVFMAPVEDTTEGHISYTYPTIMGGREIDGIKLWFEKGKVIKATATKNENFLQKMLDTDAGARYIGEFGVGTNYNITKFVKQILFDEKIGGTIHLALGMAYKEGGGKNNSALHWDMIKDLRKGGKILFDGKVIQENGKFTFKL
ncbi:MAG: aminopeptidase [Candidatus Woesearchaeota archaeon]|jgi:aminopeptidase|nr:aminopeptidase [Candidatus Woesearchaeota archaeon]MDP7323514.1 aminopeptidase [Candidatus Woesearchaeota archaeon]MDP7457507.1 aminopeptidase [Candidatus Woesearchaeota archaeon]